MTQHTIAVAAGDGIGKEVMPEGIRVVEAAATKFGLSFQWDEKDWSCDYYLKGTSKNSCFRAARCDVWARSAF